MNKFIELDAIFDEKFIVYAHTQKNGNKETLQEHIKRCEKYFYKLSEDKNIEKIIEKYCRDKEFQNKEEAYTLLNSMVYQIIVFHDLGKCNPNFQKEKMKNSQYLMRKIDGVRNTDHSILSAIFFIDYFFDIVDQNQKFTKIEKRKLNSIILEYSFVIARHHGDFEAFDEYLYKLKDNSINELVDFMADGKIVIYKKKSYITSKNLFSNVNNYIKQKQRNSRQENLKDYFYCRFLYSLLVSCDYYATTEVCNGLEKERFGSVEQMDDFRKSYNESHLIKSIRTYEKKVKKNPEQIDFINNINELRNQMFLESEENLLNSEEDILFLEAPTGSGKSNIALNISFHLMDKMKKIFYIYPFNTLVEQNRKNLMELFSDQNLANQITVVNSITPMETRGRKKEEKDYYGKVLLDRQFLNYPMILSTHVTFFRILFGCNREDIFGFLQLSDAVVVLDEIQSYKNTIWAEIIIFLKACAELMGMKIIIMSATLPNLEVLGGKECKVKRLIAQTDKYFKHSFFKDRVKISYELMNEKLTLEKLLEHIMDHGVVGKKILVEFITKKSADKFYEMLNSMEIKSPVYCITGDDSLYEREEKLQPIREKKISQCVLVTTQVIEAGVDIDMDIGYKDISKLDSEEQFLGRINRSFASECGSAYFFDIDDAKTIYKNDYRVTISNLTLLNPKMREILINKNFTEYYHQIMLQIIEGRNKSTENHGLESFFKDEVAMLDYIKIQERMQLISENQWCMDIFICRKINTDDGIVLDGKKIWDEYKFLLQADMGYAEKQYKLSVVKSKMNYFTYTVKKNKDMQYNDIIGELICIENGEKYFESGRFNRNLFEDEKTFFLEL